MPNRCFVPNCNSGFPGFTTTEKVASAPRHSSLLQRWNHAIPRQDKKLQPSSKVCSLHFEENDIIKGRNSISKDGQAIFYPWKNWSLKTDAWPRLSPDCLASVIFC